MQERYSTFNNTEIVSHFCTCCKMYNEHKWELRFMLNNSFLQNPHIISYWAATFSNWASHPVPKRQRWASTHANRSNARHRSNIRTPPPVPPRCMYSKCGNLCDQRDWKRFIASWGLRMSHVCPCTPCPSPRRVEVKGPKLSFCPPLLRGNILYLSCHIFLLSYEILLLNLLILFLNHSAEEKNALNSIPGNKK